MIIRIGAGYRDVVTNVMDRQLNDRSENEIIAVLIAALPSPSTVCSFFDAELVFYCIYKMLHIFPFMLYIILLE